MKNSNNNGSGSENRGCMKLNDDMLTNAIKKGLLDEFERPQSNHTQNPNKMAIRKMEKKQIEKNRKVINVNDSMTFDYVTELGIWIVGGYGPIDIYPDGIKFETPTSSDLPDGEKTFLPYLTECDASEGFRVLKIRTPYITPGSDIEEEDIFVIRCTNNGTTYFASGFGTLRSFVLYTNEGIRGNRPNSIKKLFSIDESFVFDYIEEAGLWVIGNDQYDSIECWPSLTEWAKSYDLGNYADMLLPLIPHNNSIELKSVCWFRIPFLDGGREIKEECILAIKRADNRMYYASQNQNALRSFILWTNECIRKNNEWKKRHSNRYNPH